MKFENDLRTRAEMLVLSALLQDNGSIRHIASLTPLHFSHDTHGQIFRHIVTLIEARVPADLVTVYESMGRSRQRLRHVDLLAYLGELCRLPARPANIGYYAIALVDDGLVRTAIRLIPVRVEAERGLSKCRLRFNASDPALWG
ncbi:replicative DNA helicase [Paraburkholderia sp. CI2]|uniref:DnaB-like helicase N-terminal domain-containing protein n=1 Tax=Paraburkholderia sp. CI2 TaxID=2723093 RepID=UPI00160BECDB|nr:DnaB-like helicase N-terminal domain-containing protein [Paraburkholderia sp. CI2]MBB5469356.1 replicative DNA helicase [Paraburkholderia sp. CI2]